MKNIHQEKIEITKLIRKYRKSLGLTQVEFIKRYGFKSTILGSLWESGKREAPFMVVNDVVTWYVQQIQQARDEEELEFLERIKLETDVNICECGEEWKYTDMADLIKERIKSLTNKRK